MKRSKSREQMKGKAQNTTSRQTKSTAPTDRNAGEYQDFKPSKSVDLTGKNNKEDCYSPPTNDSILIPSEKVVDIACGAIHTIALTNMNRVLSCGNGSYYSLGHGNRENLTQFKSIDCFTDNNIKIVKIAAGMNHSGCISDKGKVYLWGITSDTSFSPEMKEK